MPDYPGIAYAAYFRASSTALAIYEYLRIFPTALDFYMVQWRRRKISVALVLFLLLRLTSITLLIVSNYAFWFPRFTSKSCSESRFYLASPLLKLFQIMVSQSIMGLRTYGLSGRLKGMGIFLLALWTSVCLLQWICILRDRHSAFEPLEIPVVGITGGCLPATIRTGFGTWAFYGVAIIYDATVSIICSYYLIKYRRKVTATFLANLMNAMIYEGLFYFFGLTAVNIANLVFTQSPSSAVDVTAVGAAYTLVWILSQNIVLSQYHAQNAEKRTSYVLADVPCKPQRPFPPFTSESDSGPSSYELSTTLGGSSDIIHGSRTIISESIQTMDFVAVKDDSNSFGVVSPSCGNGERRL